MEVKKKKFVKTKNLKQSFLKLDNKKKLNLLWKENIENNNFLQRLLKKGQMIPDKIKLMNRLKSSINRNGITNCDVNKNNTELENFEFQKDKIELTYEIDDLLHNHSKSFSKTKKKYYQIKKENDEFLSMYKFCKNNNVFQSKKNIEKDLNEINGKTYEGMEMDDYLLMNDQIDIYFHFLFKTLSERKTYALQGPYKYISRVRKLLNKNNSEENENEYSEYNQKKSNSIGYNKIKYSFYHTKDKSNSKKKKKEKYINFKKKISKQSDKSNKYKKINSAQYNNDEFFHNLNKLNEKSQIFKKKVIEQNNIINKKDKKINNEDNNSISNYYKISSNKIIRYNSNNYNNLYLKKENNLKINLKQDIEQNKIKNFLSSDKNIYKFHRNNIDNKIINNSKINNASEEKKNNLRYSFNQRCNNYEKPNLNKNNIDNKYFIKNVNTTKTILKIKDNILSSQSNKNDNNLTYSNISKKFSNTNRSKTIIKNNYLSNKNNLINNIDWLPKAINISNKNKSNEEIYKIFKNNNNENENLNNLQNILIDKEKKEENNVNNSFHILKKNTLLNESKKRTIFELYEDQKKKLNDKYTLTLSDSGNINKRRKSFNKNACWNEDLFNKKGGRNKTSFLTDTNNIDYLKLSNEKYINCNKNLSLSELINNIKLKNQDSKYYQFMRIHMFPNKNIKKIEKANKFLSNIDKYFIKKYSDFEMLTS